MIVIYGLSVKYRKERALIQFLKQRECTYIQRTWTSLIVPSQKVHFPVTADMTEENSKRWHLMSPLWILCAQVAFCNSFSEQPSSNIKHQLGRKLYFRFWIIVKKLCGRHKLMTRACFVQQEKSSSNKHLLHDLWSIKAIGRSKKYLAINKPHITSHDHSAVSFSYLLTTAIYNTLKLFTLVLTTYLISDIQPKPH